MASDRRSELLEFLRRNAVHDGHRGQNAATIIPEMARLFDGLL